VVVTVVREAGRAIAVPSGFTGGRETILGRIPPRHLVFTAQYFHLSVELYERLIRPTFLSETWPERLIVPTSAFPWVLLFTPLWTAFLTYRGLYEEKITLRGGAQPALSSPIGEFTIYMNQITHRAHVRLTPAADIDR
jgi:hypothetical protein